MSIDKAKSKVIIQKILEMEEENLKTKRLTDVKMSERIKKLIEEEVRKCF